MPVFQVDASTELIVKAEPIGWSRRIPPGGRRIVSREFGVLAIDQRDSEDDDHHRILIGDAILGATALSAIIRLAKSSTTSFADSTSYDLEDNGCPSILVLTNEKCVTFVVQLPSWRVSIRFRLDRDFTEVVSDGLYDKQLSESHAGHTIGAHCATALWAGLLRGLWQYCGIGACRTELDSLYFSFVCVGQTGAFPKKTLCVNQRCLNAASEESLTLFGKTPGEYSPGFESVEEIAKSMTLVRRNDNVVNVEWSALNA